MSRHKGHCFFFYNNITSTTLFYAIACQFSARSEHIGGWNAILDAFLTAFALFWEIKASLRQAVEIRNRWVVDRDLEEVSHLRRPDYYRNAKSHCWYKRYRLTWRASLHTNWNWNNEISFNSHILVISVQVYVWGCSYSNISGWNRGVRGEWSKDTENTLGSHSN